MKYLTSAIIMAGITAGLYADEKSDAVKNALQSKLQNTPIEKVTPSSDMPSLYEIRSGRNIFYADAAANHLLIGHIFDLNGKDITQEKINVMLAEQSAEMMKKLDLSKALKIGTGKHTVIEFTDPDCPWCRKAESMIAGGNVTKYIFFWPLPMHQNAKPKSVHILCSKNPGLEYQKAMTGGLDNGQKLTTCDAGEKKLNEMLKIGTELGVQGTPLVFADGKRFEGANPAIEQLVKSNVGDE